MMQTAKLLMTLLRSEIADAEFDRSVFAGLCAEDWARLYDFAASFDLAHLVGETVIREGLLPDGEMKEKFNRQLFFAVYRYKRLQQVLFDAKRILNEAKIAFIPLKGSVMRTYYKQPWMRTSCDVDILIKEEDLSAAEKLFINNGYTRCGASDHDISFAAADGIHLELHYRLIEKGRIGEAEQVLLTIWDHAKPVCGSFEHRLDEAMFCYYHLAHMAKHLTRGGCGIRPFLDLWILNNRVKGDPADRGLLLEKGGLDRFAAAANALAEYWMEEKEPSPLVLQMEEFVFSGGVFGSEENKMAIEIGKRKGRVRYLICRIWMPYDRLIKEYPRLKGRRILQPLYEVRRWFRLFRRETFRQSAGELKASAHMPCGSTDKTAGMLSELGLI